MLSVTLARFQWLTKYLFLALDLSSPIVDAFFRVHCQSPTETEQNHVLWQILGDVVRPRSATSSKTAGCIEWTRTNKGMTLFLSTEIPGMIHIAGYANLKGLFESLSYESGLYCNGLPGGPLIRFVSAVDFKSFIVAQLQKHLQRFK